MNKLISFLFFFLFAFNLFCQNFSLNDYYPIQPDSMLDIMTIDDNKVYFKTETPPYDKVPLEIGYKITHIDGMSFIELEDNMPREVADYMDYDSGKEIETNNKILFIGFQGKHKVLFAFTKGYPQDRTPLTFTRYDERGSLYINCTSFLEEKNKSYPVDNLRRLTVETPWVEGVPGDGIGEGFTIKGSGYKKPLVPYLLIINGYISYEKPYLYKQNNRVKKIKVTGVKSGKSKILDILDTPHPQTVDISFIDQVEDLRVEIADVYKGSKYDDTCLHYCICFDEPVIPYEDSIK